MRKGREVDCLTHGCFTQGGTNVALVLRHICGMASWQKIAPTQKYLYVRAYTTPAVAAAPSQQRFDSNKRTLVSFDSRMIPKSDPLRLKLGINVTNRNSLWHSFTHVPVTHINAHVRPLGMFSGNLSSLGFEDKSLPNSRPQRCKHNDCSRVNGGQVRENSRTAQKRRQMRRRTIRQFVTI